MEKTMEELLAQMGPAEDTAVPSPEDMAAAEPTTTDGGLSLEDALAGMSAAPPELTEEQKALTPGYYQEHGEPTLGQPAPGPYALAEVAEGGLLGLAKGATEIYDLFAGEPEGGHPTLEAAQERIEERSPLIGPASIAIGQFAAGIIGLKGTGAAVKALPWFGRGLKATEAALHSQRGGALAAELGRDGTALFISSDPHEERLANLLEDTPYIEPVTDFLAADPEDSVALGRFKAALEGIGLDVALRTALVTSTAIFKARWFGNEDKALQLTREAEEELRQIAAPAEAGEAEAKAAVAPPEVEPALPTPEAIPEVPPAGPALKGKPLPEKGLAPANKATDGSIYVGDTGGVHFMIAEKHPDVEWEDTGFITPDGQYLTRKEALQWTADNEKAVKPSENMNGGLDALDYREQVPSSLRKGKTAQAFEAEPQEAAAQAGVDLQGTPLASARPAITTTLRDEDTASLLEAMRSDADALKQYGSRKAANAAGHTFGQGESIPYAKLTDADDVNAFLARVVDAEEERIVTAKGGAVLHDAEVQRVATERAKLFGEDPSSFLAMMQGSADAARSMVANAEAGRLIVNRLAEDLTSFARRLSFEDYTEFGSRGEAYAEFSRRYALLAQVHSTASAITSNSARATRLAGVRLEVDPALLGDVSKLDTERLIGAFANNDGRAQTIAKLAKPTLFAKSVDLARYVYVNNLISGLKTVLVNAVSNSYMVGVRPLERMLGAAPGAIVGNVESRNIVRSAMRQYAYTATAFIDGFQSAVKTIKANDSILSPQSTELYRRVQGPAQGIPAQAWKPWDSVPNALHNVFLSTLPKAALQGIGIPSRVNGFMDEMTKQTVYRSYVAAEAHMEAAEEVARLGLKGSEAKGFLREYVTDKLAAAFDENVRGLNARALEEAEVATFSQDLVEGSWGQSIQQFKVRHPAMSFILPFVKTPTNILRYGWKMTPGLNLFQKEYRSMLLGERGAEKQAQAMGQVALGTSAMLATASLVSMGNITGGGPKDPKLRQELLATGWQPYSVVVENEDGTRSYYSYGRTDPIAIPLGIVADLVDMQHALGDSAEDGLQGQDLATGALALAVALTKQFTSKSYMTGFSQFVEAIADPEERTGPLAGQMASNFVPFASFLRQTDGDEYMREARGFVDRIMNTVPGLGEQLPARYDAFGDPMTARNGLWSSDKAGIVDREMQRLVLVNDGAPTRPSPLRNGVDLRDLRMAEGPYAGQNAYEVYQWLAGHHPGRPPLKEFAARLMASERYRRAPDGDRDTEGTKMWLLTTMMANYRADAMEILKRDPAIREALTAKDRKVRDAYQAMAAAELRQRSGQPVQRQGLGEAFGVDLGGAFETAPSN